MLWIAVSTLLNHSERSTVKGVSRERMYEKCVIHNVAKQGSEKSVGVFEVVERVVAAPSLQVVVVGRNIRWTSHLDVVRVLSKGLVKDARALKGLDARHLLRTSQGEFCARKRQMRVAANEKGSIADNQKSKRALPGLPRS